jgi:heme/copper-type cytochrome/quinol oxidase subunit 2
MSICRMNIRWFLFATLACVFLGDAALAQEAIRHTAQDWQLGFQHPISPVKERLDGVHDMLLVIITGITLFVLLLTGFICVKYSSKRNPVAAKFTHNYKVELAAVASSVIILVLIGVPSLRLHYYMEEVPSPAASGIGVTNTRISAISALTAI